MLSLKYLGKLKVVVRSAVFLAGYILSPLSWWNDLFINIPLAYLFAVLIHSLIRIDFAILFSAGYALTNIAGIILMKISITGVNKKNLLRDLLLTILYSIIAYIVLENIPAIH
ncbi:hypothetical protein Smar_1480 [Staphylothermus marinus F1]|uniref:Uncharacterized protein n=1 Tax=Staphylothermus marinus (strain ATCC 43588 / DSM 3639 / JCM 9404 / F1) TaxID=399550 RepID=A3DPK9_STAMF|nr:hypothetical protein [Staphylothermus marinus]ABN70569.1 hypothetical protein Smar_1480 [Staphylothermus marinus F1]